MSQFFPNNGENSQLIPKWESKKVSCVHDLNLTFRFDISEIMIYLNKYDVTEYIIGASECK